MGHNQRSVRILLVLGLTIGFVRAAASPQQTDRAAPLAAGVPVYGYTVVRTLPHDPGAFTQGLQFVNGVFYEGTGLNGRSSIRKVKIDNGEVLQHHDLSPEYFGEGITVMGSELFQITWQSGVGFVYDLASFKPRRRFKYPGEGWGLTSDGTHLIMSDGTDVLRVIEPASFRERGRVRVTAGGRPVDRLNELEYVKGEVYANVWQTEYVARIDPKTGRVTGWIDFSGLLTPRERLSVDVLNGMAYDSATDRLFVTGKLWPKVFEVRLRPRER